jgi:hypothetical protein
LADKVSPKNNLSIAQNPNFYLLENVFFCSSKLTFRTLSSSNTKFDELSIKKTPAYKKFYDIGTRTTSSATGGSTLNAPKPRDSTRSTTRSPPNVKSLRPLLQTLCPPTPPAPLLQLLPSPLPLLLKLPWQLMRRPGVNFIHILCT